MQHAVQAVHASQHAAAVRQAREKIEKVRLQKAALEGKMAALQHNLDLSIQRQRKAMEASAKARVARTQDQLARAMRAATEAKQKAGRARSELVRDKAELTEDQVELRRDQDELTRDQHQGQLKSESDTPSVADQEAVHTGGGSMSDAHADTGTDTNMGAGADADAVVGDSTANVIMPPPLPPPPSLPSRDPSELAYAGPNLDARADAEASAHSDKEPQPGRHKMAALQSQLALQREVQEMAAESSQKAKAELCKQHQLSDCK